MAFGVNGFIGSYLNEQLARSTCHISYVADVLASMMASLVSDGEVDEIVRIDSNLDIAARDSAQTIAEVVEIDFEQRLRPLMGEVERPWASKDKAYNLLTWQLQYSGLKGFRCGIVEIALGSAKMSGLISRNVLTRLMSLPSGSSSIDSKPVLRLTPVPSM